MSERSVEQRLQELRTDLTVTTMLLEMLYLRHLKQDPGGLAAFDELESHLNKDFDRLTSPGVDAAQSDHMAQMLAESLSHLLQNIRHRTTNPDGSARPATPSA